MTTIRLGRELIALRRDTSMAQERLAAYMGVSKSSVSKWEAETTLPGILLPPQPAILFNVSMGGLVGYEPQLSMETVDKLYLQPSAEWSRNSAGAYTHSEELIRKYYSCFPFLLQVTGLYLSHYILHEEPELVMKRSEELCDRVVAESEESSLVKNAISLKITYLITNRQSQKASQLLGEEAEPITQDSEVIVACYQVLGKPKRSSHIFQTCIYQHLLFVVQDMAGYMLIDTEDEQLCDETIHRMLELPKLSHIDALHTITSTMVYISCTMVYAQHRNKESTLRMLERLIDVVIRYDLAHMKIHRDTYFTEVEAWMESLQLRAQAPRDDGAIPNSLIQELQPPVFDFLKGEPRCRACLQRLKAEKGRA